MSVQRINDLYDEGLRTIQFDDTTWGRLVGDQTEINGKNGDAKEKERLKEVFVKANNKAIHGFVNICVIKPPKTDKAL